MNRRNKIICNGRVRKKTKIKLRALKICNNNLKKTKTMIPCPQKEGTVIESLNRTPKKPNSAMRKVCVVKLCNNQVIIVRVRGEAVTVQQHARVLVSGGRAKDLIGVRCSGINGVLDLPSVANRKQGRSRYGTKKESAKKAAVNT